VLELELGLTQVLALLVLVLVLGLSSRHEWVHADGCTVCGWIEHIQ